MTEANNSPVPSEFDKAMAALNDSLDARATDAISSEQARIERQRSIAERREQEGTEIRNICGRFVTWAADNSIPSHDNIKYELGRTGWLLGSRYAVSTHSLLAQPVGDLKEVWCEDKRVLFRPKYPVIGDKVRRNQLIVLPRSPNLELYRLDSVIESVANYARINGVKWDA